MAEDINIEREVLLALLPDERPYTVSQILNNIQRTSSGKYCIYNVDEECIDKLSKHDEPGPHCANCSRFKFKKIEDIYIIRTLKKLSKSGYLNKIPLDKTMVVRGKKTKRAYSYRISHSLVERMKNSMGFTLCDDGTILYNGDKYVKVY